MDRILLEDMVFYGHHGDLPAERELGTRLRVDVSLHRDLRAAGESDAIDDTLDYVRAYQAVRDVIEGLPHLHLLEAVAQRLADALLGLPGVIEATIRVRKQPPLDGHPWSFGVEISRRRE